MIVDDQRFQVGACGLALKGRPPRCSERHLRIKCFATAALLIVVATIATGAYAASVRTVVTGLDNPRGIAIGPGARILLTEAGTGGTPPSMTGHVTEIFRGDVRRILTLPSTFVAMGEVTGPTSIAVADGLGNMFVTMGAGPSFPFGYLLRANPVRTSSVADI